MDVGRCRLAAGARAVVERLALPRSEQLERLARTPTGPDELAREATAALRAALEDSEVGFSPVLGLRLEALALELASLAEGASEAAIEDSGWTIVCQRAEEALREPGWLAADARPTGPV